ncbi:malto-oligosyltrehalose trehalohydrolase [Streptacidiphilus sp. ASG 303]|uniref:malto-oligosyltrehalose trehalohydrolase n=1 Tax=Streptacidiphilus sp. ASG 303 TaxID=2896847 RepID=UPI001E3A31A2|nr:malto-oligosyltrehalose trehalohydrolase [Streptacidiphilus sp. ASG 303]MCD0481541.1 malto-oligosyltrehalose trehalohydrolase [Streptacidiphilus sp. ASG 303]
MAARATAHPFRLWAPEAGHVEVEVDGARHPMHPEPDRPGWWRAEAPADPGGSDYGFRLDGGDLLPDPRSARQPHGPDGPSRLVDHGAFPWSPDVVWHGRALPGSVLYELHVGTFTPEGTFDAAAARLDHLVELGVDLVELMPVCPFPGRHGWGYDGVSLWAVHEPYGGPDGLKRFVDAAHRRGLGVVLDVVHNHLGPAGNHLPRFGPYFTDRHHTPWGAAVNLDAPGSDEVREYLIGSALAWLRDYRIDGLRLDAVHALADDRATPFLEELSRAVDRLGAATGRPLFLVAESDLNDPRTTAPREAGGLGLAAQWSDDFHHALHTALTGEDQGYYADFAGKPSGPPHAVAGLPRGPLGALARTLTRGWLHDGTWSSFRQRTHGRPLDLHRTPGHRLLGYLQTHDQVGNRALGDRLSATVAPGLLAAGAALVLTSPFTPMLFMGEEWGAATPWQYFTDHTDPDLAEAVRQGRRREFAGHGWKADEIPDPQAASTVAASTLDWSEPDREPHRALLAWYRKLIALRRAHPGLTDPDLSAVEVSFDEGERWLVVHRGPYRTAVNLSSAPRTVPLGGTRTEVLAAFGCDGAPGGGGRRDGLALPPASAAVVRVGG